MAYLLTVGQVFEPTNSKNIGHRLVNRWSIWLIEARLVAEATASHTSA